MIPAKPPPTLEEEGRFSAEFRTFIAKCLIKDPSKRPSAATLLSVPFFTFIQHALRKIDTTSTYIYIYHYRTHFLAVKKVVNPQ